MNLIENYLQETPSKIREVVENTENLFAAISDEKYDRIIVTGSGTSAHSAIQVREYIQKVLSIDVQAVYPFMLSETHLRSLGGRTLLVGISQGGSSYSTYNAMKTAKGLGMTTASMAGMNGAFIDEAADFVLTVFCGEEKAGAKTKGYYCTKLNLMLMALHMALKQKKIDRKTFDREVGHVLKDAEGFMRVYGQAAEWVERNRAGFVAAREIRVIGTSDLYGDTLESALKLLETMRVPVSGYEFEEFIHGVYNAIDEESTLFILDGGGEGRVQKLAEVLSGWTKHVHLIGRDVEPTENNLKFDIADTGRPFFFTPLPIQLICAEIPGLKGIDSSTPKDPQFHMKLGSKKFNG